MVAATRVPYLPDFPKFKNIVFVWCSGSVAADVAITATLVFYLVGLLRALSVLWFGEYVVDTMFSATAKDGDVLHGHSD